MNSDKENLSKFRSSTNGKEWILDSNDVFRELRMAQRVSDMVNNRTCKNVGPSPITETQLRDLQHHLNRQKKKLSLLGALMRKLREDTPDAKFFIAPLK